MSTIKATHAHLMITVIFADSIVSLAQLPANTPLNTKIDPTKHNSTQSLEKKIVYKTHLQIFRA